jgi:hypothetical protein
MNQTSGVCHSNNDREQAQSDARVKKFGLQQSWD